MAAETAEKPKADATPETGGRPPKKKKLRPTNCVQSNKRIRRKDWYYRNGKYFANKQAFKLYEVSEKDKKAKAAEAAAQKAAEAPQAPAEEKPAS